MECLRARSDDEMGKIGPSPPGCGQNRAILRCHPRRWTRHSLRIPPRLARFSSATPPARKLITGSKGRPSSLCLDSEASTHVVGTPLLLLPPASRRLERFQDRYTLSALLRGRRSLGSRRLECIPFGYGNPETAIRASSQEHAPGWKNYEQLPIPRTICPNGPMDWVRHLSWPKGLGLWLEWEGNGEKCGRGKADEFRVIA
jgi:hypothetical protein